MQQLIHIQNRFRYTVYVLMLTTVLSIGGGIYTYITSLQLVRQSRQKIYVLDNGQSLLLALRADISDNRPAEARHHLKRFHELFFTLEPDKDYIESNIREALYLADQSAMKQYTTFKENNLYNRVIASDISMTLLTDSVQMDFSTYPYGFCYYGKQKIVRKSNITIRRLITKGKLRNISRTDNNTHGFLIEGWMIEENADIETRRRSNF
ncbi:conjugative transposon protein TraK [Carboxylicivirga marina]|uniref:Conjugative transposon protein TraK n=1 Tax=Carboxylicivirga marina TaxID=2800988 RepID=A0ABS1HKR4_9BACT|nr:conjugative transposon protein TraK [Carboxylicivirga marina]MBK3518260.1 conjugative transposon protein TraK [Carboxylicivirga marina]